MRFDEDGNFYVRQSALDTFSTCPEMARLDIIHPERATESDAANAGVGTHDAIEQFLGGAIKMSEIPDYAHDAALELCATLDIRYVKFKGGAKEVCDRARAAATAWVRDIAPKVPMGGEPEVKFCVELMTLPDGRKVFIEGMIDYVPGDRTLWDWKAPGREYRQWEKQQQAIQPTVYAAAAHLLYGYPYPIQFNYGIMEHKRTDRDGVTAKGYVFPTMRFEGHHAWLQASVCAVLDLVDSIGLERPWPLTGEQSVLCSEKWCDHWSECRGKYVTMEERGWKP